LDLLVAVRRLAVSMVVMFSVVPATAEAAPFGSRTLDKGDRGSDVRTLQQLLTDAGHACTVDGAFGSGTEAAVEAWEAAVNRKVNGRVSRKEQRMLQKDAGGDAPSSLRSPEADKAKPANTGGSGYVEVKEAYIAPDGRAVAPADAPKAVKQIIAAGNEIYNKPYRYGGGHGKWKDSGYDCSGSMSYALHGAGLLDRPLDSTGFMSWGAEGRGTWVTTYAHGGHSYMVVAGLRFDTSGASERGGSRWTDEWRSPKGFTVRHPVGL
jgi:hypothetical protein